MRKALALCLILISLLFLAAGHKKFVRVEDQMTDGAAGTSPVSDGAGSLAMTAIATQAELDSQATWPEWFQGEAALLSDTGYTATAIDVGAATYLGVMNVYSEEVDHLGHWRYRSQGDAGSSDWAAPSLACWYPPQTHYVYVADHCSGLGSPSFSDSEGRPCPGGAGDCKDGGETCDAEEWVVPGTNPDQITITGHDFGATGTTYSGLVGVKRGHNGAPVHGGSGALPTCVPAMLDASAYWLNVVDANTIRLYLDDGDGDQEIGGDDVGLNCTAFAGWQGLTIHPRNADASNPTHEFLVVVRQDIIATDSTGQDLECVDGEDHGDTCDAEGTQDAECQVTGDAGVCQEVTDPWLIGVGIAADHPEGVEGDNDGVASSFSYGYVRKHDDWTRWNIASLVTMIPGECLQPTVYVAADTDLDTIGPGGGSIHILEPRRAAPERADCPYAASATASASCMYFSVISDRGAGGNVTLTLSSFAAGMNFCAVNETSNDFTVDPAGVERFRAPATDTNGDYLTSTNAGDTFCAVVDSAGEARVVYNSGGWTEE